MQALVFHTPQHVLRSRIAIIELDDEDDDSIDFFKFLEKSHEEFKKG